MASIGATSAEAVLTDGKHQNAVVSKLAALMRSAKFHSSAAFFTAFAVYAFLTASRQQHTHVVVVIRCRFSISFAITCNQNIICNA